LLNGEIKGLISLYEELLMGDIPYSLSLRARSVTCWVVILLSLDHQRKRGPLLSYKFLTLNPSFNTFSTTTPGHQQHATTTIQLCFALAFLFAFAWGLWGIFDTTPHTTSTIALALLFLLFLLFLGTGGLVCDTITPHTTSTIALALLLSTWAQLREHISTSPAPFSGWQIRNHVSQIESFTTSRVPGLSPSMDMACRS
jgi:hypothetical protein